jgi:hypothetical protein
MACKRSGVRIPIAPQVRETIRNPEPRLEGLYSSKVQQQRGRTSVRIRPPHQRNPAGVTGLGWNLGRSERAAQEERFLFLPCDTCRAVNVRSAGSVQRAGFGGALYCPCKGSGTTGQRHDLWSAGRAGRPGQVAVVAHWLKPLGPRIRVRLTGGRAGRGTRRPPPPRRRRRPRA